MTKGKLSKFNDQYLILLFFGVIALVLLLEKNKDHKEYQGVVILKAEALAFQLLQIHRDRLFSQTDDFDMPPHPMGEVPFNFNRERISKGERNLDESGPTSYSAERDPAAVHPEPISNENTQASKVLKSLSKLPQSRMVSSGWIGEDPWGQPYRFQVRISDSEKVQAIVWSLGPPWALDSSEINYRSINKDYLAILEIEIERLTK